MATGLATLGALLYLAETAGAQVAEKFEINYFVTDVPDNEPAVAENQVNASYTCPSGLPGCASTWTLQLERGGQVLGTASAHALDYAFVPVRPQAGDVVRISRAGLADVVLTYDGRPAFDDTSCAILGRTSLTGSVTGWHSTLHVSLPYGGATTVVRSGERFQATTSRPMERGYGSASSGGTRMLSPTQTLIERSSVTRELCGAPGSAPLYELDVTGPRKAVRSRVDTTRRFTLRRNRVDCPAGVPHCQVRVFSRRTTTRGTRDIGFREYQVPGGSKRRVKARLFRSAMKRLRRVGRMDVSVLVRVDVPPGDYRVKPILRGVAVTLRAA